MTSALSGVAGPSGSPRAVPWEDPRPTERAQSCAESVQQPCATPGGLSRRTHGTDGVGGEDPAGMVRLRSHSQPSCGDGPISPASSHILQPALTRGWSDLTRQLSHLTASPHAGMVRSHPPALTRGGGSGRSNAATRQ